MMTGTVLMTMEKQMNFRLNVQSRIKEKMCFNLFHTLRLKRNEILKILRRHQALFSKEYSTNMEKDHNESLFLQI